MPEKKIPLRMCVGCGEHFPKRELVRIVCGKDGGIAVDTTGRMPGRGAYICRNPECLKKGRKARRLEKAFARAIPDEVYDRLEKELTADG